MDSILKTFKVPPLEPYFSSKNNPVHLFCTVFFSMQANNLVKWTPCCSKKSYHSSFWLENDNISKCIIDLICNLNGVVDATKQHSNSSVLHKGELYFETVKFSKSKMSYLIHYLSHRQAVSSIQLLLTCSF